MTKIAINNILKKQLNAISCNLCHGNSGNFDLLLKSKQLLPNFFEHVNLEECAQQWLCAIEEQYENKYFCDNSVGLMTGLSGVAYQLLRFIFPKAVPSVLSLDTQNHAMRGSGLNFYSSSRFHNCIGRSNSTYF